MSLATDLRKRRGQIRRRIREQTASLILAHLRAPKVSGDDGAFVEREIERLAVALSKGSAICPLSVRPVGKKKP